MYARAKVRLPKVLQTRGLGAYFRTKFGNLGARNCHFLGFTRNIFEEKCNSCLLYPSLVLSVRYNMYGKKGQTATPSKRLPSKGQNVYPSVVQKVDYRNHWINLYPVVKVIVVISLILIRWIVIFPVHSPIQRFNN